MHDLTAMPSTWTVQAPHWLVSQPTWVPVRSRSSRSTWTSSRLGSTSSSRGVPLTTNAMCSLTGLNLLRRVGDRDRCRRCPVGPSGLGDSRCLGCQEVVGWWHRGAAESSRIVVRTRRRRGRPRSDASERCCSGCSRRAGRAGRRSSGGCSGEAGGLPEALDLADGRRPTAARPASDAVARPDPVRTATPGRGRVGRRPEEQLRPVVGPSAAGERATHDPEVAGRRDETPVVRASDEVDGEARVWGGEDRVDARRRRRCRP